jgi:hypothetical protein
VPANCVAVGSVTFRTYCCAFCAQFQLGESCTNTFDAGLSAMPGSNCHDFVSSNPFDPRSVTSNTARCRGSVETCTCAKL